MTCSNRGSDTELKVNNSKQKMAINTTDTHPERTSADTSLPAEPAEVSSGSPSEPEAPSLRLEPPARATRAWKHTYAHAAPSTVTPHWRPACDGQRERGCYSLPPCVWDGPSAPDTLWRNNKSSSWSLRLSRDPPHAQGRASTERRPGEGGMGLAVDPQKQPRGRPWSESHVTTVPELLLHRQTNNS